MVGKGWFNMQETSKITYDFGKLKRFLTVVRLMMQDTVLAVVRKSYHDFRDYLLKNIPKKVTVLNACEVHNHYLTDDEQKTLDQEDKKKLIKQRKAEPLFFVDLVKTKDDDFGFSVNPKNFVKMIRNLF